MSRRAHLYELTHHLRRYLLWQRALGADGLVAAGEEERQWFKDRKQAMEQAEVDRLSAELKGATAAASEEVEATGPTGPDSAPREERAKREPAPAPPTAGVTADTPLWKKHDPIHELEERRRKKRRPRASSVAKGDDEAPMAEEVVMSAPPQDAPPVGEVARRPRNDETPQTPAEKLDFLKNYLGDCRRCPLHQSRSKVVFGEGNPRARLVFIGEGPGREEDKQGRPFVGPSGELLTKMIGAMGLSREEVYITNVVKCRPPKNRNPAPLEIRECSPFLKKQIEVIEPEVIVTLGKFAANVVLGVDDQALGRLRGRWHEAMGVAVMPTYHPAYILRNEGDRGLKQKVWSDLQLVMKRLGLER